MYSEKDELKISTILEFMILARSSLEATVEKYKPGVKTIKNNLYVKDYELQFSMGSILLLWRNPAGMKYWISYKNPPFRKTKFQKFLAKLKSLFISSPNFATNNAYHALRAVEAIFEDFKNEYDLSANFNELPSRKEALNMIIYEIHHNFFYIIPFKKYCEMIRVDKTMEKMDYETLLAGNPYYCN